MSREGNRVRGVTSSANVFLLTCRLSSSLHNFVEWFLAIYSKTTSFCPRDRGPGPLLKTPYGQDKSLQLFAKNHSTKLGNRLVTHPTLLIMLISIQIISVIKRDHSVMAGGLYTLVMGGMRRSSPGYRYRAANLAYLPSQVCSLVLHPCRY